MATARPGPGGRRHASGAPLPKQRVPTPLNTTSPRPRHARYAASLIAGHAPAAESDTTTARPCAPGRKQAAGDLVVGPGLQEKSAQHFLHVGLLIANIDRGNAVHGTKHCKAMRLTPTLLPLESRGLCRAFADVSVLEGGLHNWQRELRASRKTEGGMLP